MSLPLGRGGRLVRGLALIGGGRAPRPRPPPAAAAAAAASSLLRPRVPLSTDATVDRSQQKPPPSSSSRPPEPGDWRLEVHVIRCASLAQRTNPLIQWAEERGKIASERPPASLDRTGSVATNAPWSFCDR